MKPFAIIGILLALGVTAAGWGYLKHQREALNLRDRVAMGRPPDDRRLTRIDTAGLPAPVARYLLLALGERPPPPTTVEIHQSGHLRTDESADRWMKFRAVHLASPAACSFSWDARVRLAPLIHLRVMDSLIDGQGSGRIVLQSVLEIAGEGGTHEMNSGALHRYLAEAVWYPWALMPGNHLSWTAIDERRSLATLSCGAVSVSLEFRFDEDGTVAAIHTPARWGRFDSHFEQRPWEGHFSGYRRRDGILVPGSGEAGWYRDGQLRIVWQGTVDDFMGPGSASR